MNLQDRLVYYTAREELANRLTHGAAALASVPALVVLVAAATRTGDPYRVVSSALFAGCLCLFYVISTSTTRCVASGPAMSSGSSTMPASTW